MTKEELLNKCVKVEWFKEHEIPLIDMIYIIPKRVLHDSGYRLMNVIGCARSCNTYYLLAEFSDVIQLETFWSKIKIEDLSLDITRNGIIRLWSHNKFKFTGGISTCSFDVKEKGEDKE